MQNDSRRLKLNLIAAVDKNMGIGKNDVLPWHIPNEFKYFVNITTKPRPDNDGKKRQNVIIIGRKTWATMDQLTSKPYPNSINIVLSKNKELKREVAKYKNTVLCTSLKEAIDYIQDYGTQIDEVWILGGSQIYKEAIDSEYFHRLYLTRINNVYDCDSYFPKIDLEDRKRYKRLTYEEANDDRVPKGEQTDEKTGVKYHVEIYQNIS